VKLLPTPTALATLDAPPIRLSQVVADGQAQAGAAEAPAGGAVGLLEGLEQPA
jgi:hypothetical protein